MIWLAEKSSAKIQKKFFFVDHSLGTSRLPPLHLLQKFSMKSSKGKGPANGAPKASKKLQQTASGKVSNKDPVEVGCLV